MKRKLKQKLDRRFQGHAKKKEKQKLK